MIRGPYRAGVLADMKAEAKPGLCFLCDRPLPSPAPGKHHGRNRVRCASPDCKNLYLRLWKAEAKALREVEP